MDSIELHDEAAFGLTLGGGGARGAAHVGVLLEMERHGLRPTVLTGTSIGGALAVLYSAGLSIDAMTDFLDELRITNVYTLPYRYATVTANDKLEKLLVKTIGRPTFADLKIPVAIVATDLVSRSPIILQEGDVISAVLATTALPGILPYVERCGRILVDGGVSNNVPINVAKLLGVNHVLAIDINTTAPFGAVPPIKGSFVEMGIASAMRSSTVQLLLTVLDIFFAQQATQSYDPTCDFLLQPKLGTIGILDFHRLQEGIEIGRAAFLAHAPQIKRWLNQIRPISKG